MFLCKYCNLVCNQCTAINRNKIQDYCFVYFTSFSYQYCSSFSYIYLYLTLLFPKAELTNTRHACTHTCTLLLLAPRSPEGSKSTPRPNSTKKLKKPSMRIIKILQKHYLLTDHRRQSIIDTTGGTVNSAHRKGAHDHPSVECVTLKFERLQHVTTTKVLEHSITNFCNLSLS